jgi:hypothetical protein
MALSFPLAEVRQPPPPGDRIQAAGSATYENTLPLTLHILVHLDGLRSVFYSLRRHYAATSVKTDRRYSKDNSLHPKRSCAGQRNINRSRDGDRRGHARRPHRGVQQPRRAYAIMEQAHHDHTSVNYLSGACICRIDSEAYADKPRQVTTYICVIFRLYTRFRIVKSPGWDDLFVVLVLVCGR